jgi:hypothetical protein
MSPRRRRFDPDEPLPLVQLIEDYSERRGRELGQISKPPVQECTDPDGNPEAELYTEINVACIRAIRESGFSREQVVEEINRIFPRSVFPNEGECRGRTTLNMLNNYLAPSKPDARMPVAILLGICLATDDFGPLEPLTCRGARHIITDRELVEQQLGALDRMQQEVTREKARTRQLLERVTARG